MSSLDFEVDNMHETPPEGNEDYLDDLEELLADNLAYRVETEETND